MLPSPLLYLSAFFEATRDEYYKQLYNVSSKGTWHEWLIYFLNDLAVQNDNKRDKVYCATEILNILEEPTKITADVYE